MANWTSVDITAGPYAWHYEPAVKGAPTGVLGDVLDGLTITTNYSEDHPLYGVPQPHTASFKLIVGDFSEVRDLEIGAPVAIIVRNSDAGLYDPGPADWGAADDIFVRTPLVQYLGRISDLDAVPITRKARAPVGPWGDPGPVVDTPALEVTITCVDYLADLNEITVGAGEWPAEPLYARFDRLWETDGRRRPIGYNYWWGDCPVREAGSPVGLLEIAQQTAQSNWASEHSYVIAPLPRVGNYDPGAFVPVTADTATNWIGPGNPLDLEIGDYVRIRGSVLPTGTPLLDDSFVEYDRDNGLPSYPIVPIYAVDPMLGIQVKTFGGSAAIDILTAGADLEMVDVGRVAYVYGEPETIQPYRISRVYKRHLKGGAQLGLPLPTGLPLVLEDGPSGWVPAVSPLGPLDTVVPAEMCLLDTAWRKSKDGSGVTKVTATNALGDSYFLNYREDAAPVEYSFEAVISNTPVNLTWKLLPDAADRQAWPVEEITILDVPPEVQIPWFDAYQQAFYDPRNPVVISGLVSAQNPNGTDWVAGMFVNGTFTMSGGDWQMKIKLRPDVARSRVYSGEFPWYTESGGALLYGDGEDPYLTYRGLAGTDLADLHTSDFGPTVSAYDIRLVRRPD